jgi:osmoprotectant transport system permease protein
MAFLNEVISLYFSRTSFFVKLILEHLYLSLIAIIVISFFGIFLGILNSRYEKAAPLVLNIVNFLYTIPSIALFGFLVSVTGIGNKSALIALILYGMLPMIRNTYTGIREVDSQITEAAKGMGSTERQLLYKIQLPLALPFIISGFRTMVVMTIALTGIASFIGAGV